MYKSLLLLCVLIVYNTVSVGAQQSSPRPDKSPQPAPTSSPDAKQVAQMLDVLKTQAMVVDITATLGTKQEAVWTNSVSKLTVDGFGVTTRLEGSDIYMIVDIKPYRRPDNTVYILVQWQLWYRSPKDKQLVGRTSLKSTVAEWGEPVYLYPLGNSPSDDKPTLRLELKVTPYNLPSPLPTAMAGASAKPEPSPIPSPGN